MGQPVDDIMKFAITLVSILNPIGVLPIFVSLTHNRTQEDIETTARSCSIAVFVTILISMAVGKDILNFFGIGLASFTIGGGFLLFSMAFSMINASQVAAKINASEITNYNDSKELGVIPLAIPLLSGPGAISTAIIHSKNFTSAYHWSMAITFVFLMCLILWPILRGARKIRKALGTLGLNVTTRVMGLILLAMSIEMVTHGLKEILPILK